MPTDSLQRLVRGLRQTAEADRLDERPDTDLLDLYLARKDPSAFEALVWRHGPLVLAACRKVLADPADVDDAFQATFLVLLRNARSIRRKASVGSWLYGVAHRLAVQARAERLRRDRLARRAGKPSAEPSDMSWREAVAALHEELDRLPDHHRLPLLLCYLEGLSRDQAARRLGWTVGSVKGRLERGREILRRRLERRGIALSAGLLAALGDSAAASGLPPRLVQVALRAAHGGASAAGAALARGAPQAMILTTTRGVLAVTLLAGLAVGAGALRSPAPAAPAAELPDELTYSGRVLDPDGKPLPGVKVWLRTTADRPKNAPPDDGPRATTGPDGAFEFRVKRGEYLGIWWWAARVITAPAGYGPAWADGKEEGATGCTLRLVRDDVPVQGRIIDLQGRPVAGATLRPIEIWTTEKEDLSAWLAELNEPKEGAQGTHRRHLTRSLDRGRVRIPTLPAEVKTDADGRFRLTGVGRERLVRFTVEGAGIATAELDVTTRVRPLVRVPRHHRSPGDGVVTYYGADFEYPAEPAQPFEGVVRDKETGKPIAGVTVWYWNGPRLETTTDAEGRYRLPGVPTGVQALMAMPRSDVPYLFQERKGGRAASQQTVKLDFDLTPAVWVTGRITDARTGKPIARASLEYRPFVDNPHFARTEGYLPNGIVNQLVANEDGTFRVAALPGKGVIAVRGWSGYLTADVRPLQGDDAGKEPPEDVDTAYAIVPASYNAIATVTGGEPGKAPYTITLDPGVELTGRVLDADGKPLSGAWVYGRNSWGFWGKGPLTAAEFKIEHWNPSRPRPVLFVHPGKGLGAVFQPPKEGDGPADVRLKPTAGVAARLVDEGGFPRANVDIRVWFRKPGGEIHSDYDPELIVKTDAAGRFRLGKLVGGVTYQLRSVELERGRTDLRLVVPEVTVPAGETRDLGDVKAKLPQG